MILLSPEREQDLVEALLEAFTAEDLNYKLADALNVPQSARSGARDIRHTAQALVTWARDERRTEDLLTAALQGNPSSSRLRILSEAVGLAPATSTGLLDAMRSALVGISEDQWLRGLVEAQRQVCRLNLKLPGGPSLQTGFLVGPDVVMTSSEPLSAQDVPWLDSEVIFDDLTLGLHRSEPLVVITSDVCVLRLARELAREVAQTSANVPTRARGWVVPQAADRVPGGAVLVVQYAAEAIRVAADPHGLSRVDDDTFHYRTSTLSGSLGAPVFDAQWRLLGIHVGGEREVGDNYGVTLDKVVRGLQANGYDWDRSIGISPVFAATSAGDHAGGELDGAIRGIGSSLARDEDAWSDEVEDLDLPEAERWAWAEAAAVHATFEPATLKPYGEASESTRVVLLLESDQVGTRWVLSEPLRKAALKRLAARDALAAARATNPDDPTDALDRALGELLQSPQRQPEDQRDADQLRALLTAINWLDGAVTELPEPQRLRAALERATLLAPFRHLTRGFFAGREGELAQLADYVTTGSSLPIFIHSAGGMGKSALLAHFVLENAQRDPLDAETWRPFVYLDFDRPELDAADLAGVLLAMLRQLGPQLPAIAIDVQGILTRHAAARQAARPSRRGRRTSRGLIRSSENLTDLLGDVSRLLASDPSGEPIVLILDTIEEVQFANPDAVGPLVQLMGDLRRLVRMLRPIFAGRVPVETGVNSLELRPLLPAASQALLSNELPPELARRTELVTGLAEIVGGNPLSLRLAAAVLRREAGDAQTVIEELDDELKNRVSDAIVQGRLYERILGHIHNKTVEAVAHASLVVRKITAELIRDVLAEPLRIAPMDDTVAGELFDALAKEVALVRRGPAVNELELRPELRRIVRDDLGRDTTGAELRRAIHDAAVAFYEPRTEIVDRAEEIYHRLARGDNTEDVDKRWLPGAEQFLRDAVGELPRQANVYLANRIGGVANEADLASAVPVDWEYNAGIRASNLLRFGDAQAALDLLATRTERLPDSKLHYVESVARRTLPLPDLGAAGVAAERAIQAARFSSNSDDLRDALEELVLVRRLQGDTDGVLRGLAELGNLGELLGDDLVLLESSVMSLESIGPGSRGQFTDAAVRVFNRLPDEIVAKAPELSRRVAAQVGGEDPATLQRVIRLVGTGSLDAEAGQGLHNVLVEWNRVDAEVGPFVPDASKPAYEMGAALRYLVDKQEMDGDIASIVAHWLEPVVTPKITS